MSPDVGTVLLVLGVTWLIWAAFSKGKPKIITGLMTVIFPAKSKGKRKRK